MRIGRPAGWAAALMMAAGLGVPGLGGWPLTMGAWTLHHTNNGATVDYWQ